MKYIFVLYTLFFVHYAFAQHETEDHTHADESHHHHVAVFNGLTSELEDPQHFYTLGAEYMYSPSSWNHWSISAMAEVIFKSQPEWVIVIPFVYQANERVWLRFGAGLELYRDAHQNLDIYKLPLIRIGGGYSFHWNSMSIAPSIDLDIIRNHPAAVMGLNIGYAF